MTVLQPSAEPLVVLVHGAWHGAWCWAATQAELDRRGIASLAVDLPGHGASSLALTDLYGDAQHVADVIGGLDRPIVLVGHSYGGAVITEAASRVVPGAVAHLLYVAAFALDQGESVGSFLATAPPAEVPLTAAMVPGDDGNLTIDPAHATAAFYGSCSPEVARSAIARLSPQPFATMSQPISGDPRSTIPSTYLACTLDGALSYVHQVLLAPRCGRTITFETDHSPFASMVVPTVDVIAQLVDEVGVAATVAP